MPNNIKPSTDTQFFSGLSAAVFQSILDVIPAIGVVLNWEPLALAFLADVLRQVALTGDVLAIKHLEFGRALWGDELSPNAAARRIGRAIFSLKKCQLLSGFLAVWVEPGKRIEKHGQVEYLLTTYRLRDFFIVFSEIQELSKEQDLMSLPKNQRKITLLAIVQSVCDARGYEKCPKRSRQKIEKNGKEKSPSLPCKCDCAPCAHCAAKSATGSEAKGAKAEDLRRIPNESIDVEIGRFSESLERYLRERGDVDKQFRYAVKRAHHAIDIADRTAADLITRERSGRQLRYGTDPDSIARENGRAAIDAAACDLMLAASAARDMGREKHAAKLDELRMGLEAWKLFENAPSLKLVGGQAK